MRANRLSPARIARAVSAILLLSLLQVVVPPVLAPQLTTPIASAADANNLPSGLGTVYQFLADSYTSGSTTWPEARGGTGATISSSALKVTNTAGTLGANKSVVAVQGSYLTSITFPAAVAYGNATNPNDYTFFHVARYAPQQTNLTNANYCDTAGNHITNNAAKKNRIFSSTANNWLSGFWACSAGVAFHYGWLTQSSSAVSELTGNSGNNWLLSADCGYVSSSTSACNGRYRAFGTDRTISPSTSVVGHSVVVNGGQFPAEVSDFQIAEVISYPTILAVADIVKVETYLARKYGITLSSTAATKLGIHRASVGTTLNEPLSVQPQVAVQDSNGQTVTTDNSTIITATVTGLSGRIIGTATADAVQGVATFDNLGLDGIPGNSYTLTYTSNAGLATTSESRVFTRGGGSETDTALTLSTGKYAWAPDSSELDVTSAITLEAWVYQTATISGTWNMVMNKENSYELGTIGTTWYFGLQGSGEWAGVNTGISTQLNEWQHVALTRASGSSTAKFYINGQLVWTGTADGASTGNLTNSSQPFTIGGRSSDGVNFSAPFVGNVDEVRVFRSERSLAQIVSDMHTYGPTDTSNLILYYDFNEGTGTKLYNRASGTTSASDLTIVGSPSWVENATASTFQAYTMRTFTRSYLTSSGGWKVPGGVTQATAIVVGGGGGGGKGNTGTSEPAGAGGGGGVTYLPTISLTPNSVTSIKVGQGGLGALSQANDAQLRSGQSSTINYGSSATALGGGAGGSFGSGYTPGGSGVGDATVATGGGSSGHAYSGGGCSGFNAAGGITSSGNNGGRGAWGWGGAGGGARGAATNGSCGNEPGTPGPGFVDPTTSIEYGRGGYSIYWGASNASQFGQANTGFGGNVAYNTGQASGNGYNGTSGIIIIRWITASAPIFTGPRFDTLTAGLTETFTVSGSATSPLTRNFRWQVSTDTGTSWANATTGTGLTSANYITPTLETTTSGIRYQYRVVVTDSDTAGLFIVDTSTAVYLMINPRNTITSSTGSAIFTQKYGDTRTAVFTFAFGTGPRTASVLSTVNNQNGRIAWSNLNSDSATVRVGTALPIGTYYETLTVTDSVTAFTSQGLRITVSKADTITVTTTLSTSSVTYTESPANVTVTQTVTGLVNSETATVTTTYVGNSCEYGGTCAIGNVAPGGGYVFYVSPTVINVATGISSGGIYLATAPRTWGGTAADPNATWGCSGTNISGTSSDVGSGAENTRLINAGCATAGIASRLAADSTAEDFTDWFVPSIGELNLIYSNLKVNSLSNLDGTGYWSSTQNATNPTTSGVSQDFSMGASGQTNKGNNPSVRPIRAFSPTALSSNTIPTDAGVYRVGSTFTISSSATLNNYQGVESVTATLTINKARQRALSIGQYESYPNISSFPINVYGGSGPGTLTRTLVSAGTANCTLGSNAIITATNIGTCTIRAEKAGTRNYFVESTTAVITWITWSTNYAIQSPGGNHAIPLNGGNQIIVRTETVTASAFSDINGNAISSATAGTTIRINSTGFAGLTPSQITATFRPYEDAVVTAVTSTYVQVVVPSSGAITGVIALDSPRGVAYTPSFTISP
ncbi:MAG: hypothetical protein NTY85_04205 [Actinobacteria bacterium]|nr:hypothetical protein [Actinomycetota bacterium]